MSTNNFASVETIKQAIANHAANRTTVATFEFVCKFWATDIKLGHEALAIVQSIDDLEARMLAEHGWNRRAGSVTPVTQVTYASADTPNNASRFGERNMAKKSAHTTTFLVDGTDYFAANLDTGGIRVGLKGAACIDIPAGHKLFAAAAAITTEVEADEFFSNNFGC